MSSQVTGRCNRMEAKLVETIPLENGLVLEVYDNSRPVAGDRWLVSFEARIEVPLNPDDFADRDTEAPSFEAIRQVVGEKVTYTFEKKRNFIDQKEKHEVFEGLKGRFLDATLAYLSSEKFPQKIILSRYEEATQRRKRWSRQ